MTQRKPLVAANWKMNGSLGSVAAWAKAFVPGAAALKCEVVVCPPAPYLARFAELLAATSCDLGAQDVSERLPGAVTGDVAAEMLIDVGCRWVIVGHSERRQLHAESDAMVAAKAARALEAGLRPIICVGETLAEREAGRTIDVVSAQLGAVLDRIGAAGVARGVLAYEPVWAIGTGRTATAEQAQQVQAELRQQVAGIDRAIAAGLRIVYGGSVKPSNAGELFAQPDIDGGLIGGASLVAGDFLAICAAARSPIDAGVSATAQTGH
ncbi:MAG: triose-phosphate isomerase [Burkholderiaceae bacterium]